MDSGFMPAVSPWRWVPTLYVAEGLPYVAVNVLTVIIYFQLGIPKAEMAFFTGWLYLPWVIKPFWSPFIDLFSTKRRWTIAMQFLMATMMGVVAIVMTSSFFFAASLIAFWLLAFFSATHDIAADGYYMLALDSRRQAEFVGVRSTFYRIASILGQGGLVVLAGLLSSHFGSQSTAWSATFAILAVIFLLIALYHGWAMPVCENSNPQSGSTSAPQILKGFWDAFKTFFTKRGIFYALCFMLLFRLPEALCLKLVAPFLVDARENGGLGMDMTAVGLANGTIGVAALLAGGIVGGLAISRGGLRRWMWPMSLSLTLTCAVYCWLAMAQPDNVVVIASMIGIEQFGYGFGFSAFMMYLMYYNRGPLQTSHYAFSTAFMALGMMLPGMAAGWLHDAVANLSFFDHTGPQGYVNFFWTVLATSLLSYLGTAAAMRTLKGDQATDEAQ